MLKSSTHLIIWILMSFLLDAVMTESKNHSNFQEKKTLVHDPSQNFWEGIVRRNDSNGLTSSTEISRLEGDWVEYKRPRKSEKEKTLLDYNGPTITEDPDIRSDGYFANHVRVKRSESTNDSLLHFWLKNNTIYAFGELLSTFKGPHADLNYELEPNMVDATTRTYSRYKRKAPSGKEQRGKHVQGNARHSKSKHRLKTRVRGKNRVALKSHKFSTKRSRSGQRNKNKAINVHSRKIGGSQTKFKIKKRESGSSDLNGNVDYERMRAGKLETLIKQSDLELLTNDNRSKEHGEENSIVLPFVHTEKAELRVRIEKIPADAPSFINNDSWINRLTTTSPSSNTLIQSKYETTDEIISTNVTSSELAPNCDYTGRHGSEVDNSVLEFTSPRVKVDQDSEDGEDEHRNEKIAEFAGADMKYRAKRNQQMISKHYLQSDTSRFKRFKNIGGVKHERTNHRRVRGNRAVRSIEEIKELVEKLVVKVNELQIYVSNYSDTHVYTTDSCVGEKANRTPKLSERSGYKSEFVRDTANHKHLTNNRQTISVEEPSSASRVTRENSRKKSLRKWNRWTDWSSCSVTCGKGRQIRWRHCLRDCDNAEIEMEEKACQLPACPPGKFLGIF